MPDDRNARQASGNTGRDIRLRPIGVDEFDAKRMDRSGNPCDGFSNVKNTAYLSKIMVNDLDVVIAKPIGKITGGRAQEYRFEYPGIEAS